MPPKTSKPRDRAPASGMDLSTTRALPFRLLKLTNLVSRPFFGRIARDYEISLNDWRTIFVLASHPGISAIDISEHTGLQPMNTSRSLAALRKLGYITEVPDPRDLRRTLVSLTQAGIAASQEISTAAREDTRRLFADVSAQDLEVFGRVVDQLIDKAQTLLSEPPAR